MGVHNGYEKGFDVTLEFGKEAEHHVHQVFDRIASGAKVEVKRDARSTETGRLYVEYESRGRDGTWAKSGIATSTAEFWVYVLSDTGVMIWFHTEALRHLAREAYKDPARRVEHPYGENPTRGITVGLQDLIGTAFALPFR